MHPYLLEIGNFKLATYGVLSALAYAAALVYLSLHRKQMQLESNTLWNLITVIIISALLGGKLLYILMFWKDFGTTFFERLINTVKEFRFGFVYFGGLAGALFSGIIYVKIKHLKLWKLADFFAPALALGHSIGRIGCFFAGCCHGTATNSFLGVKFTHPQSLIDPKYLGVSVHPTQLYEAAGNFILFLCLHFMLRASIKGRLKHGTVILTYLMGYGLLRFVIEFFRGDGRGAFLMGLSPSQIIAVIAFALGMAGYVYIKKTTK
ncbi:MAG TPA: prolipoprotein diacylglyceryl transferase [Elusimicrobiales bacterium]|nr:prolipoprotein diacylglyceryl transferase [Elusimicrobiales bacterium]